MVIQYPHKGKVFTPSESVKGNDGNWSASTLNLNFELRCRAEPNNGNQYIIGTGGNRITFNCIVYFPLADLPEEIKPGSFFEVWDGELLKVKESVKQFSRGQINARVWL